MRFCVAGLQVQKPDSAMTTTPVLSVEAIARRSVMLSVCHPTRFADPQCGVPMHSHPERNLSWPVCGSPSHVTPQAEQPIGRVPLSPPSIGSLQYILLRSRIRPRRQMTSGAFSWFCRLDHVVSCKPVRPPQGLLILLKRTSRPRRRVTIVRPRHRRTANPRPNASTAA